MLSARASSWVVRQGPKPVLPLVKMIKKLEMDDQKDMQVVPVSILWGKDPGKEDLSLFKLLFNDHENAGIIQKFFIVLAQGRNNVVHIGHPISLRKLVEEKSPSDQTAKKLRRVLRIHFRRQRNTILGQPLYVWEHVVHRIVEGRAVQAAIRDEHAKKKGSLRKIESLARKYAREIASDQTYSVVRMLEIFLGKLWNRMFDGVEIRGIEGVQKAAGEDYEIVYVASHRSHMDYLLINYTVYSSGLPVPHTAAGINLNFWPIGPLLRRGGAFFIRRSFAGNRLYSAVFQEYLSYLLKSGYPVSFFPEGGRSRTGRLLNLRTGMLSMVCQSYLYDRSKPIMFVPVYVGYDKVVEVRTYIKELAGRGKRPESMSQLFKVRSILKKYWGKAYVSFGEPVELAKLLDQQEPQWREFPEDTDTRPPWLSPAVKEMAQNLGVRINSAVSVPPMSLVSLGLLSAPNKALPVDELEGLLGCLLELGGGLGYISRENFAFSDKSELLKHALRLDSIRRFEHPGGDVYFFNELDAVINSYYKNNILHVYSLPSLVASFFNHSRRLAYDEVIDGCIELYPFLRDELHLPFSDQEIEAVLDTIISLMVKMGLLIRPDNKDLEKPDLSSENFIYLGHIGRMLGLVFERYAIIAALLEKNVNQGTIDQEAFQAQCQKMAQRLAILSGITNPDTADKALFRNHINLLKQMGYLREVEGGKFLEIDKRIEKVYSATKILLSMDTRFSISKISSLEKS